MWIFVIFFAVAFICDYLALRQEGALWSIVFGCAAFGLSLIGLSLMPIASNITYGGITIMTPSGNVVISQYNGTISNPNNTLGVGLELGKAVAFCEFGFVMLLLVYWITKERRKRYK